MLEKQIDLEIINVKDVSMFYQGADKIKETTKIKKFLSICNNIFATIIKNDKLLLKKELERTVDQLLKEEQIVKISQLLEAGYKLTSWQHNEFYNNKIEVISEKINKFNIKLKEGLVISEEMVLKLFFNSSIQIYCYRVFDSSTKIENLLNEIKNGNNNELNIEQLKGVEKIKVDSLKRMEGKSKTSYMDTSCEYFEVTKILDAFLNSKDGKLKLFKEWIKIVNTYPNSEGKINFKYTILRSYDYFNSILNSASVNQLKNIELCLSMMRERIIKKNSRYGSNYYTEEINSTNKMIEDIQKRYMLINNEMILGKTPDKFAILIENTKRIYQNINTSDQNLVNEAEDEDKVIITSKNNGKLPFEVTEKLKSIEIKYNILLKEEKHIVPNKVIDMNRLIKERIPEIIEKYISLKDIQDVLLKEKDLEISNKTEIDINNSHSFIIDSVNNIDIYLSKIMHDLSHKKMSDLSASQRYTQNFIK